MLALVGLIAALAQIPATPVLAYDAHLRRYPYLTDVVGSGATINWATDQSSSVGQVRWGRAGAESCTAHAAPATSTTITINGVNEYQWKAMLDLSPNTEYCYRAYLGDTAPVDLLGADAAPHFVTQLPAGSSEPFSFAVFGDWGAVDANGDNADQANVMQQLAASDVRFAITTGDNGYPSGSQANYGDLVQSGMNVSGIFGPTFWKVAGSRIPLFPAIGNHGIGSSSLNHPHLLNWPQDRAVASSGGKYLKEIYCCLNGTQSASYASAWYAFDAGNARFYILDAAWNEANVGSTSDYQNDYDYHWRTNSAEYQWLKNDLATHPSALKFAFLHYPLYSDNSTESSDTFLHGADSLEGLLSSYGVDIAFSGHAHIYQRNVKASDHSLISYVTGGGGAKPEPIGALGCDAVDAYGIGWSSSSNAGTTCGGAPKPTSIAQVYHFLRVSVDGTQVTVAPTDSRGRTFDVQVYDFAGPADTTPPSAPPQISAAAVSATQVKLNWSASTDNTAVSSYIISRDGAAIAAVAGDVLTYTDPGRTPETSYTYRVVAADAAGNRSAPSTSVTVTTPKLTKRWSSLLPLVRA